MNLESLKIGQNLLCKVTVGNAGLICWELPGLGLDSAELTGGWPGPCLRVLGPCGGIARLGLTLSTVGLLGGEFDLSALGSLSGRFGASALGLSSGRFGLSAFGLLSWMFGLLPSCGGVTGTGLPASICGAGGGMTTGGAACCTGGVRNTGAGATGGATRCSMAGLFGCTGAPRCSVFGLFGCA